MRWLILALFAFGLHAASFEEQRAQFKKEGYIWIKQFYSPQQVELLKAWTDEIYDSAKHLLFLSETSGESLQHFAKHLPRSLIVVQELKNPHQICRTEDMLSCFPNLYHFIYGSVTCYLNALLDEPFTLFKDKINFKWPGGGAFLPHQDYPAYANFSQSHVTAMVCIDPATIENGCLYVARNWKKTLAEDEEIGSVLAEQGVAVLPYLKGGVQHGSIEKKYSDQLEWFPIEAEPGDVIFFDSYLPHYSEENKSNDSRRAMFFTHNPLREGDHRLAYYRAKREDPDNPVFHIGTPTKTTWKK